MIASGDLVRIRKILTEDLQSISGFEFSVSVVEPLGDVARLKEVHSQHRLYHEEAGAVAIVENRSGRMVGTCQYFRSGPCIHGFEIGYIVHSLEDRGKGYASNALALLSSHLFSEFSKINRHQLTINTKNIASWKVAERSGFKREGTLRCCGFEESPEDCFIYSRIREDCSA